MDKTFDPQQIEARIAEAWAGSDAFQARGMGRANAEPFTIVIPPPNVTGSLHMGHALNNTLQDILTRWHRMQGDDTLWQPGTDHAGIATQMVTEREMAKNGEPSRRDMGRDKFLSRVWEQKVKSRGTIIGQLQRLGASCDWDRTVHTLDAGYSQAVLQTFVTLYERGYVYRGKRMVNWCPASLTALSDEEVVQASSKPPVETSGEE